MSSVFDDLYQPDTRSADSWIERQCPQCPGQQMIIVRQIHPGSTFQRPDVLWLRCINCFRGAVANDGALSPSEMPLDVPKGFEGDAVKTWNEARTCLGVGAYTASVMMCRKLLMHMAVQEGLPEKDDKGRAPNFFQCIEHLESVDAISKRSRTWVDKIKDIGNEANHDLASLTKEQATAVATFTRQLLHHVYELPYLEANS